MALAVRELELVLIARDNASAVVARVGGAMVILGGALTAVGVKGVKALAAMTTEAIDFRQEIALAVTQTDILGTTIDDVAGIVNRVGTQIPVPFEELNEAIFDIFSTFTSDQLSSLEDAEALLSLFAQSAVAGQAPVRDIARSTIAWINALDVPASVENATRLLDIQFELIRKGAGTYEEFAGEVGKSIPAFAAAGQSVETFGGIMAFLTKNGLNAAMAATSAARAAELMFSPKAIQGLRDVGIAVEDSGGNFRAMEDIIRDLLPVMGGLSDAQQKIKFKEIFGTGRIQARRFFDLAIPNFEELDFLIGEMESSGGSVAEAFKFMLEQPRSQMDLFKNRWEALRRLLGDVYIETLVKKVFPALNKLFALWDDLDPALKKQIAQWLTWAAAGAIVTGVVIGLLGVLLLLKALLSVFGGGSAVKGIGKLLLSLGWLGLAIAVIVGLAYLLWKNWDKVMPFLTGMWDKITMAVKNFVESNKKFFDTVAAKAKIIWEKILKLGVAIWNRAKAIWKVVWAAMLDFWEKWGADILATLEEVWKFIKQAWIAILDIIIGVLDFFIALFEGDWAALWQAVQDIAFAVWDLIKATLGAWLAILKQIWRIAWDAIKQVAVIVWNAVFEFFRNIWNKILSTAKGIWNGILNFFKGIWESITGTAKDTIDGKGGLLIFFQELPGRIVEALFNMAALLIRWIGEALGAMIEAALTFLGSTIIPFFLDLPFKILNVLANAPKWLWDTGWSVLSGLLDGIKWVWSNLIVPYYTEFLPNTLKFFFNAISWLAEVGKNILIGLWNGILWVWNNLLVPWVEGISQAILNGMGNVGSALYDAGKAVIQGFLNGLKSIWGNVTSWVSDKFKGVVKTIGGILGISSPSKVFMELGMNTLKGYQIGLQDQMKPIELMVSRFTSDTLPARFGPNVASSSTTTTQFNDQGQIFQFGDIISQADPDEIANAIAWEVRMV